MKRDKSRSGMTLIELLAAITILLIMTTVLSQVFYQTTKAASKGKGYAEIYQVARAVERLITNDLSGATADLIAGGENGTQPYRVFGLPQPPYHSLQPGAPFTGGEMGRSLMGGSDFLAFTSTSAGTADKAVSKVVYCLRESGELIRVSYSDTTFNWIDYEANGDILYINSDTSEVEKDIEYDQPQVVAENIQRINFSFLDRGDGALTEIPGGAHAGANGIWRQEWDWNSSINPAMKTYMPAAIKVEIQIADHLWRIRDDDNLSNKEFDPGEIVNGQRASEKFDPDDGEYFTFIIALPLGVN